MKQKAMRFLSFKLCDTSFIWHLHKWCNSQIKTYRRPTWIGRRWESLITHKVYPFVEHIYSANDCPEIFDQEVVDRGYKKH